jgi:ParB/RepB/Spo0J family partition protein
MFVKMDKLKRKDMFKINPKDVVVNYDLNPRKDYVGNDPERWEDFKNSIKSEGVKVPIHIFYDKGSDAYMLAHGFRRMRAVLELIEDGVDIKEIPALKVSDNQETILLDHITLNSGMPLNPVELASILGQLEKYGYKSAEISTKTGINIQKVYAYLKFDKEAAKSVKDAVASGIMKFNTAMDIVRNADSNEEQITILDEAQEKAEEDGCEKITSSHVKDKKKSYERVMRLLSDELAEKGQDDIDTFISEFIYKTLVLAEDGAEIEQIRFALRKQVDELKCSVL